MRVPDNVFTQINDQIADFVNQPENRRLRLRLVVVEGLKPTLMGVAIGLMLAFALVRVMASLLFDVSQHDPRTFVMVPAIVIGVGLLAMWMSAYRATRVDPIDTLRAE